MRISRETQHILEAAANQVLRKTCFYNICDLSDMQTDRLDIYER